ncbi:MAG: DUF2235 domain-containing protein [Acidobacteriota bacterium]
MLEGRLDMELDALKPCPKRLVVVMDGTWNSPATPSERDDGDEVFKPTNPLKTCRAVKDLDDVATVLIADRQPTDGETLTLAGKTYTFVTELEDIDGHVRIADDAKDTLENLAFAIDKRRHRSRRYADATTRHPSLDARKVAGDPRSLELVPRRDAASDPYPVESTVTGWLVVSKAEMAGKIRDSGRDPASGTPQIVYYDVGVGALRQSPGVANKIQTTVDRALGGARGAGFEGNIEDGYLFLSLNYWEGDEIYLFGFSRGASAVRGLSRFIDWMGGLLRPDCTYWIPRFFDAFLAGRDPAATRDEILSHLRQNQLRKGRSADKAEAKATEILGSVTPARVRFLGVWDSVLSIGEARERPHFGDAPAAIVDHARQGLAIDERRPDFAPRIWRGRAPDNPAQTLEQRWFAGVHSNIGGGYVHDGLANIALRWMLSEARAVGLGLDWSFLSHYRGHIHDRLYDSNGPFWRFLQTVTFRRHVGERSIDVDPNAGLCLDGSVFDRLAAGADQPEEGEASTDEDRRSFEPYRPANLLRFLARQVDLDALIAATPDVDDDFVLPEEVRRAIRAAT